MLDEELLQEYMDKFYGYGTYKGRYWFVGMEEGGGKTLEATQSRITRWRDRGSQELEDLPSFASTNGPGRFFRQNPVAQSTWKQLIRTLLSAEGKPTELVDIKTYQRDHLGRHNNQTCLSELLPLPSQSTGKWIYGNLAALPQLITRATYSEHYAPIRARHIKERIAVCQPPFVVFYGWGYRRWWQEIAGVAFTPSDTASGLFHYGKKHHTTFAIVKHPASRGVSNDYFASVGSSLASSRVRL